MTEPALHIETFGAFIQRERDNYPGNAGNSYANAFDQLDRYLRFLSIIKKRHDELEQRYLVSTDRMKAIAKSCSDDERPPTDSESVDLARWREHSVHLLLEMESFFQFAYIALTKAAGIVEWYFGPQNGFKFGTHDKWTKGAREYCRLKRLAVPDQLFPILQRCLNDITDPRSYHLVHEFNTRTIFGIQISADGLTSRFKTHLFPRKNDEHSQFVPVNDAYILLSDYVGCLAELIVNNRQRGRLRLIAPDP